MSRNELIIKIAYYKSGVINCKELLVFIDAYTSAINEGGEELKRLAHNGLPDDCVERWDEVKFCSHRQGDGNLCKMCSHYS